MSRSHHLPSVGPAQGLDQGFFLQEAFWALQKQAVSDSLCHAPTVLGLPPLLPQHRVLRLSISPSLSQPVSPWEQEVGLTPHCVPKGARKLSGTVCGPELDKRASRSDFPPAPAGTPESCWDEACLAGPFTSLTTPPPLPAPPLSGGTLVRASEKSLFSCLSGSSLALTALQEGAPRTPVQPGGGASNAGLEAPCLH